jgi:hypothetical protein
MRTPQEIAEKFNELNIHDDTLAGVKVLPSQKPKCGGESVVEVRLIRNSAENSMAIQFTECANLRIAMDFDVLAGNLKPNTSGSDAHTDVEQIRDLMRAQEVDWDVGYGGFSSSPLWRKMGVANELVFFRVQFFGGVVEVIARDYKVTE